MILTVTPQEVAGLRKGLARLIKHKRDNIRNIRRKMEEEPSNAEANAIRIGMIERRLRSIVEAEGLLAQLIPPPTEHIIKPVNDDNNGDNDRDN